MGILTKRRKTRNRRKTYRKQRGGELLSIKYVNPEIPITNQKDLNTNEKNTTFDPDIIYISIRDVITRMNDTYDEVMAGTAPESYSWSLYDQLNIPKYSLIHEAYIPNLHTIFIPLHHFGSVSIKDTDFLNSSMVLDILKNQPTNIFINLKGEPARVNNVKAYKIHLCVKEEYVLYAMLKVLQVMKKYNADAKRTVEIKCKMVIDKRSQKLTAANTLLLSDEINGGVAPSIVVYPQTQDANELRIILNLILKAFPEEEKIGNMELTGTMTIPFGNIRLNHMLCYAQGDRSNKLDYKIYNKRSQAVSHKFIPAWLTKMKGECSTSSELQSKNSELFFGFPICDSDAVYNAQCIDPICYLAVDETMLDPHTVDSPYISTHV